jgi:hypothetical protein
MTNKLPDQSSIHRTRLLEFSLPRSRLCIADSYLRQFVRTECSGVKLRDCAGAP